MQPKHAHTGLAHSVHMAPMEAGTRCSTYTGGKGEGIAGMLAPAQLLSIPMLSNPQMCHSSPRTDIIQKIGKLGRCRDNGKGDAEQ